MGVQSPYSCITIPKGSYNVDIQKEMLPNDFDWSAVTNIVAVRQGDDRTVQAICADVRPHFTLSLLSPTNKPSSSPSSSTKIPSETPTYTPTSMPTDRPSISPSSSSNTSTKPTLIPTDTQISTSQNTPTSIADISTKVPSYAPSLTTGTQISDP